MAGIEIDMSVPVIDPGPVPAGFGTYTCAGAAPLVGFRGPALDAATGAGVSVGEIADRYASTCQLDGVGVAGVAVGMGITACSGSPLAPDAIITAETAISPIPMAGAPASSARFSGEASRQSDIRAAMLFPFSLPCTAVHERTAISACH